MDDFFAKYKSRVMKFLDFFQDKLAKRFFHNLKKEKSKFDVTSRITFQIMDYFI